MKKSLSVPLVFLGTIGTLSWLGSSGAPSFSNKPPELAQVDVHQEFYSSAEDCAQDWGSDPANCTPETSASISNGSGASSGSSGGGAHGTTYTRYSGPRYYWFRTDSGSGYPVAIDQNGNTRPISHGYVAQAGPSASPHSISSTVKPASFAAHAGSSANVSRGGFGHFGSSFAHSSGG